uniref:Uncharacterized protein n=1 Tax=Trichobilharzia regenti TaxID=157069 RepID=A0AA85JJ04_TRIRE|nr:unnamed protein product [Trichobilharzia regenti]
MSHTLEDLLVEAKKKNCQKKQAGIGEKTPGKQIEDGGDENNQRTAKTTSRSIHNQRERFGRDHFLHLSGEHGSHLRQSERIKISKPGGFGRVRYAFINLKPVWKSSTFRQHERQDSDFQQKCEVSHSILLHGSKTCTVSVMKMISNKLL